MKKVINTKTTTITLLAAIIGKLCWKGFSDSTQWIILFLLPVLIYLIMRKYKNPDPRKWKGTKVLIIGLMTISYLIGISLIIKSRYLAFFNYYKAEIIIIIILVMIAFVFVSMYAASLILDNDE